VWFDPLCPCSRPQAPAPRGNARPLPANPLPTTRRARRAQAAGSTLAEGTVVEVSPLLSYEGEQLAERYDGKLFDSVSMSLEP
jgi:hypothetical protein